MCLVNVSVTMDLLFEVLELIFIMNRNLIPRDGKKICTYMIYNFKFFDTCLLSNGFSESLFKYLTCLIFFSGSLDLNWELIMKARIYKIKG